MSARRTWWRTAEALAGAREKRPAELADAAASGAPSAAGLMRQARAAEAEATDELDAAKAGHAKLVTRLGTLEDEARAAANKVVALVDNLIRSEAGRVLDKARAAAEELKRCRVLMQFFARPHAAGKVPCLGIQKPAIGEDYTHAVRTFGQERADRRARSDREATGVRDKNFAGQVEADIKRHIDFTLSEIGRADANWWSSPDLGPWQRAREALLSDADAPLPE